MVDKSKRGFAAMDPETQREIARLGGQTAHRLGKGCRFTQQEARVAGKKGGLMVSRDRDHRKIAAKSLTFRSS